MTNASPVLSGGCQCGAVRYALYAEPAAADICHCRMCQKAMGNLFMATASVPQERIRVDQGRARHLAELRHRRARFLPPMRDAPVVPLPVRRADQRHDRQPGRARARQAHEPDRHREPGAVVPRAGGPSRQPHRGRPAARRRGRGGQPPVSRAATPDPVPTRRRAAAGPNSGDCGPALLMRSHERSSSEWPDPPRLSDRDASACLGGTQKHVNSGA